MYKHTSATTGACFSGGANVYRQQCTFCRAATHCVGEVCPAPQLLTPTVLMWEWLVLVGLAALPCRALSSSLAQLLLWEAIR